MRDDIKDGENFIKEEKDKKTRNFFFLDDDAR